jgi:hypothetical protein
MLSKGDEVEMAGIKKNVSVYSILALMRTAVK